MRGAQLLQEPKDMAPSGQLPSALRTNPQRSEYRSVSQEVSPAFETVRIQSVLMET